MCTAVPSGSTHHINGIDVGKLREELTTAEGELGVRLQELLSGEKKTRHKDDTMSNCLTDRDKSFS